MIGDLLSQLETPFTCEELFDHLPDIVYFIKDARGKYLVVNQTLVERCGLRDKGQIIGRTAGQVLPAPMGSIFDEQDQTVLCTGQPLISQLEHHVYPSREVGWCLTTKLPLRSRRGGITGLVGVSQDLKLPDLSAEEYQHLATAIDFATAQLSQAPSVELLAGMAGMSRYQLDRRMRRVFGLTTGQWLLKLRVDRAQRLLRETKLPIASIAVDVGYADQSAFSRQFRRTTGRSPRDYRSATAVPMPN